MQWNKAQFQLQDGTKFIIVHSLPLEGVNNIDQAFTAWCDTHLSCEGVGTDPAGDLIRYINAHDKAHLIRALSVSEFEKISAGDIITDESRMTFGQHKGKRMIDIPPQYLLYILEAGYVHHAGIKKYITDNMQVLKSQVRMIKR